MADVRINRRIFWKCVAGCLGAAIPLQAADRPMPVEVEHDRFFLVPVTLGGGTMRMLADTGGGVFVFDDAAVRLKLDVSGVTLADYKGMAAKFPEFEAGKGVPAPKTEGDVIPIAPGPVRMRLAWVTKEMDGLLGQGWFGDRVWTLDYHAKTLIHHEDGQARVSDAARKLEMGFYTNERGERLLNFPRIEVVVGGKSVDMLLSTGCSTAVTADALKVVDEGGPSIRAASLVSTSLFEEWNQKNPTWRIAPNAEEISGEPMIEVPEVSVAGFPVGPIWFTRRPDDSFTQADRPVVGAIGGNVLKYFRIVLDYPNAAAWFEKR